MSSRFESIFAPQPKKDATAPTDKPEFSVPKSEFSVPPTPAPVFTPTAPAAAPPGYTQTAGYPPATPAYAPPPAYAAPAQPAPAYAAPAQPAPIYAASAPGPGPASRVPIERLDPNPDQPRKDFDETALQELSDNIKALGLLQPILVRPHPTLPAGHYQILAGERRWRASKRAGLAEVPVVVREVDDRAAMEIGLAENLMRDDLHPLEEAEMMQQMIEKFDYTYDQLAERLGKGKNYIWHRTNLLKLPDDVRVALANRARPRGEEDAPGEKSTNNFVFSPGHAEVVGQITDAELRTEVLKTVFEDGLSVAETRRRLKLLDEASSRFSDKRSRDRMVAAILHKGISTPEFIKRASKMKDRVTEGAKTNREAEFAIDRLAIRQYLRMLDDSDTRTVSATELIGMLQADLKRVRDALAS